MVTPVVPGTSSDAPVSSSVPTVLVDNPSTDIPSGSKSCPSPISASLRTSATVSPSPCVHSVEPLPQSRSTSVSAAASEGEGMLTAVTRRTATTARDAMIFRFM